MKQDRFGYASTFKSSSLRKHYWHHITISQNHHLANIFGITISQNTSSTSFIHQILYVETLSPPSMSAPLYAETTLKPYGKSRITTFYTSTTLLPLRLPLTLPLTLMFSIGSFPVHLRHWYNTSNTISRWLGTEILAWLEFSTLG